jgi:hypothetical protein
MGIKTGGVSWVGAWRRGLFRNNVALRFNDTGGRAALQIVHKGTVILTITPAPARGLQPFSVNIVAVDPFRLGSAHPEVDNLVYPLADALGIPPQFIKAQMAQESDTKFNPKAGRYEPLSPRVGDYGPCAPFRRAMEGTYQALARINQELA